MIRGCVAYNLNLPIWGRAEQLPRRRGGSERVISLPMHPNLTEEQKLTVIQALKGSVLKI